MRCVLWYIPLRELFNIPFEVRTITNAGMYTPPHSHKLVRTAPENRGGRQRAFCRASSTRIEFFFIHTFPLWARWHCSPSRLQPWKCSLARIKSTVNSFDTSFFHSYRFSFMFSFFNSCFSYVCACRDVRRCCSFIIRYFHSFLMCPGWQRGVTHACGTRLVLQFVIFANCLATKGCNFYYTAIASKYNPFNIIFIFLYENCCNFDAIWKKIGSKTL